MTKKIISAFICVIMVLTTVIPERVWAAGNNDSTTMSLLGVVDDKAHQIDSYSLKNPGTQLTTMKDSYGVQQNFTYNKVSNINSTTGRFDLGYKCSVSTKKDSYFLLMLFCDDGYGELAPVNQLVGCVKGETSKTFTLDYAREKYVHQPYIYVLLGLARNIDSADLSTYQIFKVKNPDYVAGGKTVKGTYAIISNETINESTRQYTGSFSENSLVQSQGEQEQLDPEAYKTDAVIPFDAKEQAKYNLVGSQNSKSTKSQENYVVGDTKAFYVKNMVHNSYYKVDVELMYSGKKADVWVYKNEITKSQAEAMGKEFDNKISGIVTENFGSPSDVDHNGKVNILCYDIQDNCNINMSRYVAGYFNPLDLYEGRVCSNGCEIFYVDTYPTMGTGATKDVTKAYSTLAHEFQHMVNYNETRINGTQNGTSNWLDEGMSMAAEQMYLGTTLKSRIDYYNTSKYIKSGESFLDWTGDAPSEYALSYLFVQYLKIQAGQGNKIFKELMTQTTGSYKDVENIVHKYIDKNMTFSKFLVEFRAALLLKEKTGLRGFKGDSGFNAVKTPLYTGGGAKLESGGAIVRNISNGGIKIPDDKQKDITYTIINVKTNTKPAIKGASNKTLYVGQKFDVKKGISASDKEDGNLTSKVKVSGSVNTKKAGNYYITYSVTDSDRNTISKKIKVTVINKFKTFTVNSVDRKQGTITGKGLYKAKVQAYVNGKKIGKSATVNKKGQYKLSIPKQKAGKKIVVKMSKSWYKTTEKTVKVLNTFGTFTMDKVKTKSKKVTGKGLKGATIKVYVNGKKTGKTVKVGKNGKYSVSIPKQKSGKKVEVRMEKLGYRTAKKSVKVKK